MSLTLDKLKLDAAFKNNFSKTAPDSYMFAVRGALPTKAGGNIITPNDNKPWINNDTVGIVSSRGVQMYKGTVEPGYEWNEKSKQRGYPGGGVFHLSDGLHRAFKGIHNSPSQSYPAFRIVNANGWRDRNHNFTYDAADVNVTVASGINIHKGSSRDWIGLYSAGCTNVIASQWNTFKELGYSILPQNFDYWVVSYNTLEDLLLNEHGIKIYLNGIQLERSINTWLDNGITKVELRPFLNQILYNGEPLKWKYQPNPHVIIVWLENSTKILPINLVNNRGSLGISSFIGALDCNSSIEWDPKERSVRITSQKLTHTSINSIPTVMSYEIIDGQKVLRWDDLEIEEEYAV